MELIKNDLTPGELCKRDFLQVFNNLIASSAKLVLSPIFQLNYFSTFTYTPSSVRQNM